MLAIISPKLRFFVKNAAVASLTCLCFMAFTPHTATMRQPINEFNAPPKDLYPQDFSQPMTLPIKLAGNFGELRTNHFHAGLDCKTESQENLPLYALADGYVSRIKIEQGGYGKALYITYPNGFTSVYAHLNGFSTNISAYLKQMQYRYQTYEIDQNIPAGAVPIKRGEMVALSGNTGASRGPHLHFEIRDTQLESALNPLLFGFYVEDPFAPVFQQVGIYGIRPHTDSYTSPRTYQAIKQPNNQYTLKPNQTITTSLQRMGVGIMAYDKTTDGMNRTGIYNMQVFDNENLVFSYTMNKIPFDKSRAINSHLDFVMKQEGRGDMQKCFLDKNNPLQIYDQIANRGFIDLTDQQIHKIKIILRDFKKNESQLTFSAKYDGTPPPPPTIHAAQIGEKHDNTQFFSCTQPNYFEAKNLQLTFPEGTFYSDFKFELGMRAPQSSNVYSPVYQFHNAKVPVHSLYDIAIVPLNLPEHLQSKAIIAYQYDDKVKIARNNNFDGKYVRAKARDFGEFWVTADNTAPSISPINISNGKNMAGTQGISFSIGDNLSGIKSYDCFIDGRWVLMEYDAKKGTTTYKFDEMVEHGKHDLTYVVTDLCNNKATYTAQFSR